MFCMNCGIALKSDTIFCPKCGTKVPATTQEPQASAPVQVVAVAQPVQQPMQQVPTQDPTLLPRDPGKGFGIAALVLGLISLILGIFCSCLAALLGGFIPLACGILGIIFGAKGCNASQKAGFKNGCAKAGLILSILGVAMTVLFCAFYYIILFIEEAGTTRTTPYV